VTRIAVSTSPLTRFVSCSQGTDEHDIELPAFEYPHVPSARRFVREHIEVLEAVTPVSVSPRASSGPQVLFFGECGGSLLAWVPEAIIQTFGRRGATALNGKLLGFALGEEDRVVAAFRATGLPVWEGPAGYRPRHWPNGARPAK
jgi:hypothetical protein